MIRLTAPGRALAAVLATAFSLAGSPLPPNDADHEPLAEVDPVAIAESLLRLAASAAARGDQQAAVEAYETLLNSALDAATRWKAMDAYAAYLANGGRLVRAVALYEKLAAEARQAGDQAQANLAAGRALRTLGSYDLAIGRFYAVLNSSLQVPAEDLEHYRRLTQMAMFEIAETQTARGDHEAARKAYARIQLLDLPPEARARAALREAETLHRKGQWAAAIGALRLCLAGPLTDPDRLRSQFLLCDALRQSGRDDEAFAATLQLLQQAHARAAADPAEGLNWQRRAGNLLANDLYRRGEFARALAIYRALAALDDRPSWQWPALYQAALCEERLHNIPAALELHQRIRDAAREGEALDGESREVAQLAAWRIAHLGWTRELSARMDELAPGSRAGHAMP